MARLVTQNVDGLHQRAAADQGGGAASVIALHGDLYRVRCTGCRDEREDRSALGADGTAPRCPRCDALLRPGVVWFGESLPETAVERAWEWAGVSDVALVVGTSAVVHPAASLPLRVLEPNDEHGHEGSPGYIIEVNPQATPLSAQVAVRLSGPAGSVLPALLAPGNSDVGGQV